MVTYAAFGDVVVVVHDVSGQSEVTDLHDLALRQEDIPGCEVSMHTLHKKRKSAKLISGEWHLICTIVASTSNILRPQLLTAFISVFFIPEFIFNTVSYCFIKRGLCVNMPVGRTAVTTGYLGIITMKLNEWLWAAVCACLVILALAVLLLYSVPGLSPPWAQQPWQNCLSHNHWFPWSPPHFGQHSCHHIGHRPSVQWEAGGVWVCM